eukprot:gene14999-17729_t
MFTDKTFSSPLFFLLLECCFNAVCVLAVRKRSLLDGFTPQHIVLGMCMMVGHGLGTVGYYELNYTTATLFKSAKVVTVMIVSSLFGRTVSSKAIVLALVLCLGLSVFGIADKMAAPRFSLWGVTANLLSLIVTAFTSNLQD